MIPALLTSTSTGPHSRSIAGRAGLDARLVAERPAAKGPAAELRAATASGLGHVAVDDDDQITRCG